MAARGTVAAGDPRTAAAGARMLDEGGSAVDAVVAAALTACVVEGPLASPAGAGVLLHGGPDHPFEVLDFFTAVPGRGLEARPELDFFGVEVDFGAATQVFHIGRGSASVPSAIFGLVDAHAHHGRLSLSTVVAPAVHHARAGYALSTAVHFINDLLLPIVTHSPSVAALYCEGDALAPAGAILRNPALADFLEALGREGAALLRGAFTDQVLDAFGPHRGGLLTRADLDDYQPVRRRPLAVPFGRFQVLTNPPPSSGGALIGLGLRLAEGLLDGARFLGPRHFRTVAQVLAATSAARVGGFDALIAAAAPDLLSPHNVGPWRDQVTAATEPPALGSTTHISVLTRDGDAASLTVSNGEGCGTVLEQCGVHMNNFLGEEDINPGGFHQLAAGTWMTTMMAPTIALDQGRPVLVLGSGGSNRLRAAVLQGLLNRLSLGTSLDAASNAPRMHVEGEQLWYEAADLPADTLAAAPGVLPKVSPFAERNMFFGGVHAVAREPDGTVVGAGDRRRSGAVA